jgi:hypothetical protein
VDHEEDLRSVDEAAWILEVVVEEESVVVEVEGLLEEDEEHEPREGKGGLDKRYQRTTSCKIPTQQRRLHTWRAAEGDSKYRTIL